ncbi:MAG: uroporphyrinogen decarboxylase [Myxococcota bacterium]
MRQPKTEPSHSFIRACFCLPTEGTPVWIMRQAGRYLPEYQAIRRKVGFLELCKTPELAAQVTLQPVDRLGVDAAILFSDILVTCEAMGQNLRFEEGRGPILEPVRTGAEVEALAVPDPSDRLGFVLDAVTEIRKRLAGRVPLIGFAGAPFTLASYMVEGGSSRSFSALKGMLFSEPATYRNLMEKITSTTSAYLSAQIEAGAQAVQIFDTWGGVLSLSDFREHVLPFVQNLIESLPREDVPVVYYVGEAAHLIEAMVDTGADVIGIDWRLPLFEARRRIGGRAAVQGNLDPAVLLGPVEGMHSRVESILTEAGRAPGYIFNLGHGILPETRPENAEALVEAVHRLSRREQQLSEA